jgi:metallo-beta-lactamase class B
MRSLLLVCAALLSAADNYTPANAEWNKPIEPFRIAGNLYYVGASDVSSYLITTPEGHFLLDNGFRETVPQIEANIRELGFNLADIRFLLTSHGHYDHVGGMAELKAKTKATLVSSSADAPLMARGGKGDLAFGDQYLFPPAVADRLVRDGEQIQLGGVVMTAHLTPGHTPGCTTWTTRTGKLNVVFPCSISAPGYQLVNNPKYPNILDEFEATFASLKALPCDVFLGFHSWDFDLHRKRQAAGADNAFIDPAGYQRWIERGANSVREAAAKQRAAAAH